MRIYALLLWEAEGAALHLPLRDSIRRRRTNQSTNRAIRTGLLGRQAQTNRLIVRFARVGSVRRLGPIDISCDSPGFISITMAYQSPFLRLVLDLRVPNTGESHYLSVSPGSSQTVLRHLSLSPTSLRHPAPAASAAPAVHSPCPSSAVNRK